VTEDPVSWLLIERGWKVVAADGRDIGTVDEVVGDTGKDIFDGLTISTGVLGKPRYVAAERVRSIVEGRVELDLDEAGVGRLDEYEQPAPSEEILPVTASWWDRLRGFFAGR
jgi:hypothetical protein